MTSSFSTTTATSSGWRKFQVPARNGSLSELRVIDINEFGIGCVVSPCLDSHLTADRTWVLARPVTSMLQNT